LRNEDDVKTRPAEPSQARIRLAVPDDAEDVTRLIAGFRAYYSEELPPDEEILAVVRRLIPDPATEYLLAGEPAVGVAQLRFRLSVWTGTEDAWLEDLFVEPDARGAGAGRALTEAAVERARLRGCARIQLDANEANERALGLYRALGFETGSPARWDGGRDLYFTKWL
jgi:ribosomal protein S18 acetylase RimI-like enzyme